MFRLLLCSVALCLISPTLEFPTAGVQHAKGMHASVKNKYTRAHSLGGNYTFDPRDGWQHVNVTNMQYAQRRPSGHARSLEGRGKKGGSSKSSIGSAIANAVKAIKGMKGIGKPEEATITWYTGHDLLNPSCWSNPQWAPTDGSFACALTLEGWNTRPKCFQFLELCSSPKKCVFARVVDSCAGCAKGSKHVDLTRAAFGQLAAFSEGVLPVQFRMATEPNDWFTDLWGPKN